ncbi:MAG: site-specific tyrosine recombinase XerC [Rhodanobacteraceae bacterium]
MVIKRKKRVLRRKPRLPSRSVAADPSASSPLRAYLAAFLEATLALGLSAQTARIRQHALDRFIRWCDERGVRQPQDVTRAILTRYQGHLYHARKTDGHPLAFSTQANRLQAVKAFFKWCARENHLLANPASELVLPKLPHRLPQVVLKIEEVEAILNQPDVATLSGLRDRAMLETLYSTASRRMELAHLKLFDLDTRRGTLMVRQGKGARDRLVPVGERACAWCDRYLNEVRPQLVAGADEGVLFLTDYGEPFEKNRLGELVKRYLAHAGLDVPGACHLFRHACATHMLENGADIRYIQVLLGHAELSTTQLYTQVSIAKLRQIHAATHPAKMTRTTTNKTTLTHTTDAQVLLAALNIEAADESDEAP